MKWLFLYSQENEVNVSNYSFVPYKYGPFSFEAYHNLHYALARFVHEDSRGLSIRPEVMQEVRTAATRLGAADPRLVDAVWDRFHSMDHRELISYVYKAYPWYASRSELRTLQPRPLAEQAIYTIGYEGRSIDMFFNAIMEEGLRGILDVRRNAYSQKYGFSGHTLRDVCMKLELTYTHLPLLGIASEQRRDVRTAESKNDLFAEYEESLNESKEEIAEAASIISARPTTLLCFEADERQCHRGRLALRLASVTGYHVKHL